MHLVNVCPRFLPGCGIIKRQRNNRLQHWSPPFSFKIFFHTGMFGDWKWEDVRWSLFRRIFWMWKNLQFNSPKMLLHLLSFCHCS